MLQLALQRHSLGQTLPLLLQAAHSVHAQHIGSAQNRGLFNQGMALCQVGSLCGIQWRTGFAHCSLPQWLQLGELLFAQMATIAPGIGETVQLTCMCFPVGVAGVLLGPSFQFFHQRQPLCTVGSRFGLELFQPLLHHFVGLVAGFIKTLPQRMVGRSTLVGLFPGFAQGTQAFLDFSATWAL